MTSYGKVYDAFLAKILEDEWGTWAMEEIEQDLNQLYHASNFLSDRVQCSQAQSCQGQAYIVDEPCLYRR